MSTSQDMQNNLVIVRAHGDEPVQLKALSATDEIVEVVGDDMSRPLGFVRKVVYRFDPDLFMQLRTAYDRNDKVVLGQLWHRAHNYRPLSLER